MEPRRKLDPYCGDVFNLLAQNNKEFQWSYVYRWYSSMHGGEHWNYKIWSSGLVKAACMLEVCDFSGARRGLMLSIELLG